jgi:hypothetical protein
MRLRSRLGKLERDRRSHHLGEPCRWHQGIVIYPIDLERNEDGHIVLPACEAPATCPGAPRTQIFLPARKTA